MKLTTLLRGQRHGLQTVVIWCFVLVLGGTPAGRPVHAAGQDTRTIDAPTEQLREELRHLPYRIVFESRHGDQWALKMIHADGSGCVILTKPGVNELYPHVSPDGKKICYLADEGEGAAKSRNIYYRNLDGTDRHLVVKNGRDPCWTAGGAAIVYMKGELANFTFIDYASKGVFTYDLATGTHRQHAKHDLLHLYNICCSADGKWYLATVHAAMGYGHANVSIEAHGQKCYDLGIPGCRPDISYDGKRIAWGAGDCEMRVGELDFTAEKPRVVNVRTILTSQKPIHIYHIDWSPDGKYVAFSRGPSKHSMGPAPEFIGIKAPGWDICVADASKRNRWVAITNDGQSNKEPDWVPLPEKVK
jgi:hypothetical protein